MVRIGQEPSAPPPDKTPSARASQISSIPEVAKKSVEQKTKATGGGFTASLLPKSLVNVSQKAYYATFGPQKIQEFINKKDFEGLLGFTKVMYGYTTLNLDQLIRGKTLLEHIMNSGEQKLIDYLFQSPKTPHQEKLRILYRVLDSGKVSEKAPLVKSFFSLANASEIAKIFNKESGDEAVRSGILTHLSHAEDRTRAKFFEGLDRNTMEAFLEKSFEQYGKGEKQTLEDFVKNIDFLYLIKPSTKTNQEYLFNDIINHATSYNDDKLLTSLINKIPGDLNPVFKEQFMKHIATIFQENDDSRIPTLTNYQAKLLNMVLKTGKQPLIKYFLASLNDSSKDKILKSVNENDKKIVSNNLAAIEKEKTTS